MINEDLFIGIKDNIIWKAMFGLSHVIIVSTDQYPETTAIRIYFNYLKLKMIEM